MAGVDKELAVRQGLLQSIILLVINNTSQQPLVFIEFLQYEVSPKISSNLLTNNFLSYMLKLLG